MYKSGTQVSIIILADTLFYPPRRNGFSVRYYPLVDELTKSGHQVDIIVINKYREGYTSTDIKELEKLCNRIDIINADAPKQNTIRHLIKKVLNFSHKLTPFGVPYHLIDNNKRYYQTRVHKLLTKRMIYDCGVGVGVGGNNADILLSLHKEARPQKIICDFVDSAYLLLMRSSRKIKESPTPLTRLEMRKTRQWEISFCKRCDCIYISEEDARTVGGNQVHIIPNCVVEDGFDKSSIISLNSPNIAFLGNMSYPPNIEACLYLITKVLPALRSRIPDICLYIVGRNPTAELLSHDEAPTIHFTGEVDNIWDYIRSADAFVFPMQTGAGLQNKVLEAMYAGKPVVTSPIGNEGIGAQHGRDIYIANTLDEYVDSIENAILHSGEVGDNASKYVQRHFSSFSLANSFEMLLKTT